MARLVFAGAEAGHPTAEGSSAASLLASTLRARTGVASFRTTYSGAGPRIDWPLTGVVANRKFFCGMWVYISAAALTKLGSAYVQPCGFNWSTGQASAQIDGATGNWIISASGIATVFSAPTVVADTWTLVEMSFLNDGQAKVELRINGALVATSQPTTTANLASQFRTGLIGIGSSTAFATGEEIFFYDDLYINDDQGSAPYNGFQNDVRVYGLRPASDGTVGANWKMGDLTAAAGQLWDTLNNNPISAGTITSATKFTQPRHNVNSANAAADQATVNLPTPQSLSLASARAAYWTFGWGDNTPATASTTLGYSATNPAVADTTATDAAASAAGAYPQAWNTLLPGGITIAPAISPSVAPTFTFQRRTATTGQQSLSHVALILDIPDPLVIAPVGIASEEAVGAPLLGNAGGPQSVLPLGIASGGAVPAPAVVPGPVGVGPAGGIASRQAFGTARAGRVVVPTGIGSGEAVGSPLVGAVGVAGIASGEAFGALVAAGPVTAAAIASAEAFGTPEILGQVRPPGLPSREAVGTPQITGGYHRYDFVPASAPQTTTNGVTRDFPITLSGLGSVKDVEVSLYLTNPGGLAGNAVTLIAPNGQSVALIPNNGGGNRTATGAGTADQQRTHFDSEAAVAWGSLSTAPWVGRFRPSGNLAALNGTDPNGVWRLRVADRKQGNTVNTIRVATLLLDVVAPLVPQTLSPPAIASAELIGAATVGGPLLPPSIASREAVGQPVVQSVVQFAVVFGLAIASRQAVGTPVVVGPVTPTSVASVEAVGTPTVDLGAAAALTIIDAGAIASAEGVGAATLTQTATVILAVGIPSGETFGEAAPVIPPWVVVPPAPDGSTAPGSGPVVGPAPTGRRASYLRDPLTNYNWPLNHSTESAVTVTRASSRGAPRLDVGFARQQEPAEPLVLRLEGVLLDPAQLAALENFYDRCGLWPVVFHDADGDEYEVIITAFDAHRVRGYNPHTHGSSYWRYSMQLDVLRVLAGAYGVLA